MSGGSRALRWRPTLGMLGAVMLLSACQAEQRPGTVKSIGPQTGSVSASVSAAPEAKAGAVAKPAAGVPKGDGVYTPVSDVSIYHLISLDVNEINTLTNAVNDGKALPGQEILAIYENAKHAKVGDNTRPLRRFATDPRRAQDFPDEAAFYTSNTFLDEPVIAAINGSGQAADYSPAQRRQAIQKGILRILRYYTVQELLGAETKLKAGNVDPASGAPHNVDEAWAIYVGAEADGKFPYSLSNTAQSREGNFQRPGTVDKPLREALERAKQAAMKNDLDGFNKARGEVLSRFNALFYLASARYLNEALKSVQAGKPEGAPPQLIEGFSFYQTIQPIVARADAEADKTIVAYYRGDPSSLTIQRRDQALEALNNAFNALGLKSSDRLSPADYQ